MIAHSAYHFAEAGGVGIRHLADIYVFRKHYKLNEEYLAQEFEKCGLRKFQVHFEKLKKYFFEDLDADEFTLKLADYVLSSSVLANEEKKSASEISDNKTKGKTLFKILFPSAYSMKFTYPILNKAIYLLPVFYIVRWFRVIIKTPTRLSRIKRLNSVTDKEIKQVNEIRTELGINNLTK